MLFRDDEFTHEQLKHLSCNTGVQQSSHHMHDLVSQDGSSAAYGAATFVALYDFHGILSFV